MIKKVVRCAIYTRKSSERGLELEFNSLHAQREACEAYIKSQAIEGWRVLSRRYDDAAFSGGSLERPAVQQLLRDVASGHIDVVVVYKIDRLTRSLTDFAKLVEQFESRSVSFVAVTQQFNTTTSMGRLTLNVLLSFAQFERELASERVRDKVAASRKKGKWTGGNIPLGYDVKDKKLVINSDEAKTVRYIFKRYLKRKSFRALIADLDSSNIVTKKRILSTRKTIGGARFTYGPLAYLLKNRTYLGETSDGNKWFPGEHAPIIDRYLFQKVQDQFAQHAVAWTIKRSNQDALLAGILFDDHGNRMSPSFTTKNGVRYRFYVSAALLQGRPSEAGSVPRVSALQVEKTIGDELIKRKILTNDNITHAQISTVVEKITISKSRIEIESKRDLRRRTTRLELPWMPQHRPLNRLEEPDSLTPGRNNLLVQSVARAHFWLKMLESRKYKSIGSLAKKVSLHPKVIREMIRLAFLSPEITTQILNGSQPAYLNLKILKSCNRLSWREQGDELLKLVAG